MSKPHITRDALAALLDYDPDTGSFRWKVPRGRVKCGSIAGAAHTTGHIYIETGGRSYPAARLAWLLMTGHLPGKFVDHIDGDPANNRFKNLREATRSENSWNMRLTRRNTSGLKGASWYAPSGKWASKIRVNGRLLHLGYFPTAAEAHAAYAIAAARHFGTFARLA